MLALLALITLTQVNPLDYAPAAPGALWTYDDGSECWISREDPTFPGEGYFGRQVTLMATVGGITGMSRVHAGRYLRRSPSGVIEAIEGPYGEANLDILLAAPLVRGTSWVSYTGQRKTVTRIGFSHTVPAGTFRRCLEVTVGKAFEIWCPNVGRVRLTSGGQLVSYREHF